MIRKSMATTVRATQDIWWRQTAASTATAALQQQQQPQPQQLLFPSAALHMVDHHLHSSDIIPRVSIEAMVEDPARIYEHDWFCASQSVVCFPYEGGLIQEAVLQHNQATTSTTTTSAGFQTHVWVTRVGNSSLQLDNMITCRDKVLAMARRAFVRKARDGKSAPFQEEERRRFQDECGSSDELSKFWNSNNKSNDNSDTTTIDSTSMPALMERLPKSLPPFLEAGSTPVLTVQIGLQHINFGNHADHAFLAGTAFQALQIMMTTRQNNDDDAPPVLLSPSLKVTYVSEAKLGQQLECYVHQERVYVVLDGDSTDAASSSAGMDNGNNAKSLVLVAE